MNHLVVHTDERVDQKFKSYTDEVRLKLKVLRDLIIETASEMEDLGDLEETLKWGEPSYLVKKGSTIRIDWKAKTPNQYAMYFKCTSKLVSTFREVFGNLFQYENNRAILFSFDEELPREPLKKCIAAALRYHLVKELPRLGITKA